MYIQHIVFHAITCLIYCHSRRLFRYYYIYNIVVVGYHICACMRHYVTRITYLLYIQTMSWDNEIWFAHKFYLLESMKLTHYTVVSKSCDRWKQASVDMLWRKQRRWNNTVVSYCTDRSRASHEHVKHRVW